MYLLSYVLAISSVFGEVKTCMNDDAIYPWYVFFINFIPIAYISWYPLGLNWNAIELHRKNHIHRDIFSNNMSICDCENSSGGIHNDTGDVLLSSYQGRNCSCTGILVIQKKNFIFVDVQVYWIICWYIALQKQKLTKMVSYFQMTFFAVRYIGFQEYRWQR